MAERRRRMGEYNASDEVAGHVDTFLCDPCGKSDRSIPADVFCSTCDEFQCKKCSNIHTVYAYMEGHDLLDTNELKSRPVSCDMKGLDKCKQHQKVLEFLCKDDDTLCCSTCVIANHRNCLDVVELDKVAEDQEMSTHSATRATLKELKTNAETIVTHTRATKEQLRRDVNELPNKIDHMQEKVNIMFEDLKVHVSREAKVFQSETDAILSKEQSSSEHLVVEIKSSLMTMNEVYENGTSSQRFIVEHQLRKKVGDFQTEIGETLRGLKSATVSFDFHDTMVIPPGSISEYIPGQLMLKFAVQMSPVDEQARPKPSMQLEKIASVEWKQTGDIVNLPVYSGLDFLPEGRLVAVDNWNKKLLIYNERLEKARSYQLSFIPQGVVAVSEEVVAITSPYEYKIEFFRVSVSNEITQFRRCKVQTRYDSICMKNEKHFVAGAIAYSRPVRVVSMIGEEKDFNLNFPKKTYERDTSACAYITSSDKLVLTDTVEHTVYIYDIATNTKIAVKDERIKSPRGVAEGPAGCILVCSENTNSLVQIATNGEVLACFKLDMELPCRVAVSRNMSTIAVSNCSSGEIKLQLFKQVYT